MFGLITLLVNILTLLVILHVIFSYVLSPYHPMREALDRIIEPVLAPIRALLPNTGPLDFSPVVLLLLIQLIGRVLITF